MNANEFITIRLLVSQDPKKILS